MLADLISGVMKCFKTFQKTDNQRPEGKRKKKKIHTQDKTHLGLTSNNSCHIFPVCFANKTQDFSKHNAVGLIYPAIRKQHCDVMQEITNLVGGNKKQYKNPNINKERG